MVAEADGDLEGSVATARLARRTPSPAATAAEEAAEEVKGVVVSSSPLPVAVRLDAIVAVAIVD